MDNMKRISALGYIPSSLFKDRTDTLKVIDEYIENHPTIIEKAVEENKDKAIFLCVVRSDGVYAIKTGDCHTVSTADFPGTDYKTIHKVNEAIQKNAGILNVTDLAVGELTILYLRKASEIKSFNIRVIGEDWETVVPVACGEIGATTALAAILDACTDHNFIVNDLTDSLAKVYLICSNGDGEYDLSSMNKTSKVTVKVD